MPVARPYWDEQEMLMNSDRPEILAIGDSWFWYPFNNLLNPIFNIWNNKVILAIGKNGALLSDFVDGQFRQQIVESLREYSGTIRMVILSGGGNHFAGLADFDLILKDNCSGATTIEDCYEAGQPKMLFDTIESSYRALILRIQREIPKVVIVTHNYDYAVPSGKGFIGMGNWLKKPMQLAKVKADLQAPLINDLIDRFGDRLRKLAKANAGVNFVKSSGTLTKDDWANELHPTPSGFNKIAKRRWDPVVRPLLP